MIGNEVLTDPYVAGAVGYVIGQFAEHRAVGQAADKQARLFEAAGLALGQENAIEPTRMQQVKRWVGRNAMTPVALTAAVALGASSAGWLSNDSHEQTLPALEAVVDHSGTVGLDKTANRAINAQVSQLGGMSGVVPEALIAQGGGIATTALTVDVVNAKHNLPFGDAPLTQATQSAIDNIGRTEDQRGAVVVLTRGNSIGSVADVAQEARAEGDIAVSVVNVDGSKSEATPSLKKIAQETHGEYWDVKADPDTVAKGVKQTINAAHAEKPVEQSTNWFDRIAGIVALGAAAGYYRRRKTYALGKGPKGE